MTYCEAFPNDSPLMMDFPARNASSEKRSGTAWIKRIRALSAGGSPLCCNKYIAYYETTSKALRLATWNGSQWTDELVDGGNGDTVRDVMERNQ